jgi:flagellar biosynthesis activator protein FlaF
VSNPLNPYGRAADAYGNMAASTDPRALEGQILLKAAAKLEQLAARLESGEKVPLEDISDTLDYNRKLWTVFASDTMNPDHPLPLEIKSNIATLAVFIFKRTLDVTIDTRPEKLKALIEINRNIAAGLMKQQKQPPLPAGPPGAKTADKAEKPDNKPTDSTV